MTSDFEMVVLATDLLMLTPTTPPSFVSRHVSSSKLKYAIRHDPQVLVASGGSAQ